MKTSYCYLVVLSLAVSLCLGIYVGEYYGATNCRIHTILDSDGDDIHILANLSPGR
jgi:hypothetical protein